MAKKVAAVVVAGEEPIYLYTSLPQTPSCINDIEVDVAVSGTGEIEVNAFFLTPGGGGIDLSQSAPVTAQWARVNHRMTITAECLKIAPFIGFQTAGNGEARYGRYSDKDKMEHPTALDQRRIFRSRKMS